jgi:hypothetical protein
MAADKTKLIDISAGTLYSQRSQVAGPEAEETWPHIEETIPLSNISCGEVEFG